MDAKLKQNDHVIATSKDGFCRIEGFIADFGENIIVLKTPLGMRVCRLDTFTFRKVGRG